MTGLTAGRLVELREHARRAAGSFVDPARFRDWQARALLNATPAGWAATVLGRPVPDHISPRGSGLAWWEIVLLLDAADADAAWLAEQHAARLAEAHAEFARADAETAAQVAAERAAWHALRDRLPVLVTVGHNWTVGHYDGHVTGRDHIVVQAELSVGRLRRPVKACLCETLSRDVPQARGYRPLRGVDRVDDGKDRVPTCAGCLGVARRVARDDTTTCP